MEGELEKEKKKKNQVGIKYEKKETQKGQFHDSEEDLDNNWFHTIELQKDVKKKSAVKLPSHEDFCNYNKMPR